MEKHYIGSKQHKRDYNEGKTIGAPFNKLDEKKEKIAKHMSIKGAKERFKKELDNAK